MAAMPLKEYYAGYPHPRASSKGDFEDFAACSTAEPSPEFPASRAPYKTSLGKDHDFADFSDRSGSFGEFKLSGIEDLTNTLSEALGFLPPLNLPTAPSVEPSPLQKPMMSPPPGLAPPPGLSFDDDEDPKSSSGPEPATATSALPPKQTKARQTKQAEHKKGASEAQGKVPGCSLPKGCTTAMLRNIPNKYTQDMLVEQLFGYGYHGSIDFLYMPIDFKNKCNVGYAFINFRTPAACTRFAAEFHAMKSRDKLPGFQSNKVCEVSPARLQGYLPNVQRLQCNPVMETLVQKPEWLPRIFDDAGEPKEFPVLWK